jgi:spore germination protein KB
MLESGNISTRQFTLIIFTLLLSSSLFSLPQILIAELKQDAWQVMIITLAADGSLALVYYILGLRYPQQSMFKYAETILGTWLGKIISFIFVVFFSYVTFFMLKMMTDFISTIILPDTPQIVVSIILLLLGLYAVNAGLEVIVRICEIIAPLILIPLLLILSFSLNRVELENLLPVFQHSIWEVVKSSLLPIGWYAICILMGVLMAYHNNPKQSLKAKIVAVGSAATLVIMTLLSLITVFGTNYSSQQTYPLFRLAQIIEVGDFFERIETLVIIFWIAGTFISLVIFYYVSVLGLAQLLNLKKYQSVSPFFGLGILILSLKIFANVIERSYFMVNTFPFLALFVEYFLAIGLLIVSFFRHGIKKTRV